MVVTNDELGEYYEGDGADADADSPSDPASHGHGHSHSQGHGRHHFGASTLVVNGVKRKDGSSSGSSGSSSSSSSGSGIVFECDVESVCRSHHDRAPQMVVKKRDGSNRDQQHADNENESGSGPGVDATTTYGIVGTKVQTPTNQRPNTDWLNSSTHLFPCPLTSLLHLQLLIKFLRATDSFIRVSEIEIKTQSY